MSSILLACLYMSVAYAGEPLTLTPNMDKTELTPFMSFLIDEGGQLTLNDMLDMQDHMSPLAERGTEFGIMDHPVWFHCALSNEAEGSRMVHLIVAFPQLDEVDVYLPDLNGEYQRTLMGDNRPYHERPVLTRYFTLPVNVPPGISHAYIRVRTSSAMSARFHMAGPKTHLESLHHEQILVGIYYGMALGLILYNLFLFFTTRESSYGYFTGYAAASTSYIAALDGLTFPLWPNALYWQHRSIFIMIMISLCFVVLFQRAYLCSTREGLADRFNLAFLALSLIFIPVIWFAEVAFGLRLVTLFTPLVFSYQVVLGVLHWRRGSEMAPYYLAAWSGMVVAVVLSSLAARGVIDGFHLFVNFGLEAGVGLVMVLLSIGMGHRINILKKKQLVEKEALIAARAESDAKSLFLARMSHELRTPMNAVLGSAQLLEDTPLNEGQKNLLNAISSSGDALLTTINDILDFSKLEVGKMDLENNEFDLSELMQEVNHIFQTSVTNPDLHLSWRTRPDTPVRYLGDKVRIRQVLLNLVGNAVKFTDKGSISMRASSVGMRDGRALVTVEVWDTGVGISPTDRERLFQPFAQSDVSTSRKYGGTGLGLSISRQLAQLMGGDVRVKSQPGQGSCFSLTMMLDYADASTADARESHVSRAVNLQGMRVLVAEDNKVNRMVIKGFLRKLGISVTFAEDGQQALDAYGADPKAVDLILMDCEMPAMDGYTATRAIRRVEHDEGLEPVPIVALTAHALDIHRKQCLEAGMDSFLAKPIKLEVLADELLRQIKLNRNQSMA